MSLNLSIRLECLKCEKINTTFKSSFKVVPDGIEICEIMTEAATVPGSIYELRLVGRYPEYMEGRECSSNIEGWIHLPHIIFASERSIDNNGEVTYKKVVNKNV